MHPSCGASAVCNPEASNQGAKCSSATTFSAAAVFAACLAAVSAAAFSAAALTAAALMAGACAIDSCQRSEPRAQDVSPRTSPLLTNHSFSSMGVGWFKITV